MGLGFSGFQGLGQCEYSGLESSGQGECLGSIRAELRLRVFRVSVLGSGLGFSGFQGLGQYECSGLMLVSGLGFSGLQGLEPHECSGLALGSG